MSAEDAYMLLESIAKISGTQNRLKRMTPEGHEVLDEQLAEENRKWHVGALSNSANTVFRQGVSWFI